MMIFYAMPYLTCKSHNYYYMEVLQGKTNYNIYHKQNLPHHICLQLIIINYKIQMFNWIVQGICNMGATGFGINYDPSSNKKVVEWKGMLSLW